MKLSSRDWQRLAEAQTTLVDAMREPTGFGRVLGEILTHLIPAERVTVNAFKPPGELMCLYEPTPDPLEASHRHLLWTHAHEIPCFPDYVKGSFDGPFSILTRISRSTWRERTIYQEWLRKIGTEDAVSVLIPLEEGRRKLSLNLTRNGRTAFTTRHLTLLTHLRTFLKPLLDVQARRRRVRLALPEVFAGQPGPEELRGLNLSRRQAEVLWWLSEGKSYSEIALILNVAHDTVAEHVSRVFDRLGVDNRHAAAATAWRFLQ